MSSLCKHAVKNHSGSSICPKCFELFLTPKQEDNRSHLSHGQAVDPIRLWKGKEEYKQKVRSNEVKCQVRTCTSMCCEEKRFCIHVGTKHSGSMMCPDCLVVFFTENDILQHAHFGHGAAVDPLVLAASKVFHAHYL